MNIFKKATLATVLGATALTAVATPAMAQPYYERHHSNGAGAAIAGGIIGLALGAMIASSANNHHGDYRYRYADRGWTWRDGYYWDRDGRQFYRDGRPCDEDRYDRRGYDNYPGYGYPRYGGYQGYGGQDYYGY